MEKTRFLNIKYKEKDLDFKNEKLKKMKIIL